MTQVPTGDDEPVVLSPEEATAQMEATYTTFPELRAVDPAKVQERLATKMRGARSLDDLFDALTGSNSKSLVGKTFEFRGVEWQPYESQRGIVPLAIVDAVNVATGEAEEFITTGGMLVEFLRQAQILDVFPFRARIVEKLTRSGQTALNFERA